MNNKIFPYQYSHVEYIEAPLYLDLLAQSSSSSMATPTTTTFQITHLPTNSIIIPTLPTQHLPNLMDLSWEYVNGSVWFGSTVSVTHTTTATTTKSTQNSTKISPKPATNHSKTATTAGVVDWWRACSLVVA